MAKENFMDSLSLTRRDFLKGLAAAGLLGGSLGSGWNLGQGTTEIPKWDKEADVVVVGSGGAGLSTAITAHDAGAKVVILEKLSKDQEGGNTKVSGNLWWAPTDLAKGIEHIRALSYGTLDEESIKALAEGLFKNNDWVTGLGGEIGDISKTPLGAMFAPEYPELPGADCVHAYSINGMVGMGLLWKLLRGNVDARGIEVLYETPGKELVTDDKGEVIGVIAEKGGAKKAVKAKKAVVLACGSYEFDFDMQEDFLPGWPIYCIGSPGNTGDGIKMAQKVGAAVWHMCNPMGGFPGAMMVPEYPGLPVPLVLLHIPVPSNIYVNKLGKRFMNEDLGIGRHGFGARETVLDFSIPENEHLCIPSYMIFDEAFVTSVGPLSGGLLGGWFGWHSGYEWSKDNSAEIAKGWIKKAGTIGELAAKIKVDATTLEETLTKYNQYCKAGEDHKFGRSKKHLVSIRGPPYFAVELWPAMVNLQGGPKRNAKCQILDPYEKIIPRLYGAGECGSFWGWMYNGGGNIGECMVTGRIAGRNAAAEKA